MAAPASAALPAHAAPDFSLVTLLTLILATLLAAVRAARRGLLASRPRRKAKQMVDNNLVKVGSSARSQTLSAAIIGLSAIIGAVALLYPFLAVAFTPESAAGEPMSGSGLMLVLLGLCFVGLLLEIQGEAVGAKLVALLGVLVAINSVLRFVEVGIPGPGGFSPVFVLIILTGYVFGGRFGFLMGALTMLVSGLITGGVGPWLPAQMIAAGWVGLSAPLARPVVRLAGRQPGSRREVLALAVVAGVWGLLFGAVMNLFFWPFMAGPADQYWQAGVGLAETAQRYAAYYVATSLLWDGMRVVGNVGLMLVFGGAALRALRRFRQRFDFDYRAQPELPRAAEPVTHPQPVPGAVSAGLQRG